MISEADIQHAVKGQVQRSKFMVTGLYFE